MGTTSNSKMAKEKKFNPVQAQHKADKAKAIKKGTVNANFSQHDLLASD